MTDIVHVASGDAWAGAEAQVAMLAVAQVELGLRPHVVTFCPGELERRAARASIGVTVIDEREGAAAVWQGLRKLLWAERPAILHTHGYKESILGFASSLGMRIARVRTLHGVPEAPLGASGARLWAYDAIDRALASALRVHWIAVSNEIHTQLVGSFGRRVHRVANAVSVRPRTRTSDQMRAMLGLGEADVAGPVLLYAGRLEPVKGPDILIDGLPGILRAYPRAVLLIAGSGGCASALEEQVARLGIQDHVRLLGHRMDVHDLMGLADLFVMPSRGEGMPTVLLEAMASGCAVVATNVGAVREVTRNGALAKIVPPDRPDELADACVRLLLTCGTRSAVSSAVATEIGGRYSPARMARNTLSVYSAALAEIGKGPLCEG